MSTRNTLLGMLVGLAAGAAIGVLLAPRSGKETRDLLRKKGKRAKEGLNELLDEGFEKWKEARSNVVERAHMTKSDIKDFLRFMKAEGADLKDRLAHERNKAKDATTAQQMADQAMRN